LSFAALFEGTDGASVVALLAFAPTVRAGVDDDSVDVVFAVVGVSCFLAFPGESGLAVGVGLVGDGEDGVLEVLAAESAFDEADSVDLFAWVDSEAAEAEPFGDAHSGVAPSDVSLLVVAEAVVEVKSFAGSGDAVVLVPVDCDGRLLFLAGFDDEGLPCFDGHPVRDGKGVVLGFLGLEGLAVPVGEAVGALGFGKLLGGHGRTASAGWTLRSPCEQKQQAQATAALSQPGTCSPQREQ